VSHENLVFERLQDFDNEKLLSSEKLMYFGILVALKAKLS
jgi:hypothetical protein